MPLSFRVGAAEPGTHELYGVTNPRPSRSWFRPSQGSAGMTRVEGVIPGRHARLSGSAQPSPEPMNAQVPGKSQSPRSSIRPSQGSAGMKRTAKRFQLSPGHRPVDRLASGERPLHGDPGATDFESSLDDPTL